MFETTLPSFVKSTVFLLIILAALMIRSYVNERQRNPNNLPYPPGPKGYPIIGNLFDIPALFLYKHFKLVGDQLGSDIVHVSVLGYHLIVLNSKAVVDDLLDKRSAIYSGRPRMPMLCELMGFGYSLGFTDYGQYWKDARRLFHQHFSPTAVVQFRPKQLKSSHLLLRNLLESPERWTDHLALMAGSVILDIGYGIQVNSPDNFYIRQSEEALQLVDKAGTPGAWLVDIFPCLKHVPAWIPGAGFKYKALAWRKALEDTRDLPFEFTKREMAKGTAQTSFSSLALNDIEEQAEKSAGSCGYWEMVARNVAATLYTAGADTSVNILRTWLLAMLLYPEAKKSARAQVDAAVGCDHLPTYDDEAQMPYITAMMKETLRWQQVAPFAIPHVAAQNDVYRGYFIPKGAIIMGNAWAICHDEKLFPDPFSFKPERFLDPNLDPRAHAAVDHAFGFGRRMCPGRYMAYGFVWITMAGVLATFDIEKPRDKNGVVIEPSGKYSGGILGTPEPFEVSLKPRSREAMELISHIA
jgi:cytochrome P450